MQNNSSKFKKKITLMIDTSSNQHISVGLRIDDKTDTKRTKIDARKAQVVLPMLEKLLNNHRLKPTDITAIEVHTGPGSFTGLRVGISIANALSFALHIPINGNDIDNFVAPRY